MQYRDFGKTGLKISQLGYGCMRLPEVEENGKWRIDEEKAIPMLRRAYELGVNYFDTAVMYCHDQSQYTVGRAIKPFRDKILLSTKLPMGSVNGTDDFRRILEQSLERLDTPYIDFYHFHALNQKTFDEKVVAFKLMDEARKALDEGLIKHISFSFHDRPEAIKYIIDRGEIFASILLQYNLLDRGNEEMMAYAKEQGLGVVVMGPVAGGRLAAPSELYKKLLGKESKATPELALRFVLGNPNVSCALSGMGTMEMVEQNTAIAAEKEPMSEEDWAKAGTMMEEIKKFSDLYCTGCSYCMPCPKGINIPAVFNAHTYRSVYGLVDHAKSMYKKIKDVANERAGSPVTACVNCGACAKKCPQFIDIPKKLREVDEEFADC
ncbi:MAG: aldo/keto reductase [Clostridia bacterium]|nr:aldo/keto reductase [Clostridia bacterium]